MNTLEVGGNTRTENPFRGPWNNGLAPYKAYQNNGTRDGGSMAVDLGLAADSAVDAEPTAKSNLAVDLGYKTVGFGGGSRIHCQIHCQTRFGGGRLHLAVDF